MGIAFEKYIRIGYSGAETCESRPRALRVYMADQVSEPREVMPFLSPRKYRTRKEIGEWLVERLSEPSTTLAGIHPFLDGNGRHTNTSICAHFPSSASFS